MLSEMIDYSEFARAARAVVDPNTPAADLANIAELQPGLWAQVAGHPNAYPDLLTWLDSVGDTPVKVAIAARRDWEVHATPSSAIRAFHASFRNGIFTHFGIFA